MNNINNRNWKATHNYECVYCRCIIKTGTFYYRDAFKRTVCIPCKNRLKLSKTEMYNETPVYYRDIKKFKSKKLSGVFNAKKIK